MNLLLWKFLNLVFVLFGNPETKTDYFEGKVNYKHEVIIKNMNLDSSLIKKIIGEGSTLFFKDGNYMHDYNGGLFRRDLYRREDNKIYFWKYDSDTCYWIDCGKAGEEIVELLFTPNKEKILGIQCDELVIHYKDKIVSDYFNSDSLTINPDWFKNYKLDGQHIIDEKEKAICLKNKIEYPEFIFFQTAVSFSREKIDGRIFELPPGAIFIELK